jgi:hypothetical protein
MSFMFFMVMSLPEEIRKDIDDYERKEYGVSDSVAW